MDVGTPVAKGVPVVGATPVAEDVPGVISSVGHGTVLNVELGAAGFKVGMVGMGLRPPAPSSVVPNGIPTRPTAAEPVPDGDEADDAGFPRELPAVTGQVPDAVPAVPPPSNEVVGTDVPVPTPPIALPMPDETLPVPNDALPMPDELPAGELSTPKDASGIEPPIPPQVELVPVVGLTGDTGDVPDVSGLTPSDCICVAPRGMPAGGTGAPGPRPSGDVAPSGGSPGVVCAKPELQPRRSAVRVAVQMRVMVRPLFTSVENSWSLSRI